VTTLVGDSDWSINRFTFLIAAAPSPPLSLELVAFDNSFVSFRWQQPQSDGGQPISAFKIYREDLSLSDTEPVIMASVSSNTFSYSD
jgi:hypothetical protein